MREAAVDALGKKRVDELSCRCNPPVVAQQEQAPADSVVVDSASPSIAQDQNVAVIERVPAADAPAESSSIDNNGNDVEIARDATTETNDETSQDPSEETGVDEIRIDIDVVSESCSSPPEPKNSDVKTSDLEMATEPEVVEA